MDGGAKFDFAERGEKGEHACRRVVGRRLRPVFSVSATHQRRYRIEFLSQ
jgi:hypothetical protein